MIISASYKTDIPAYYGEWFINRLNEGYCVTVNPINGKSSMISLRQNDIEGVIFWTKNIIPFKKHLAEVEKHGYPFYIQYTITGNPKEFEPNVPDWNESVIAIREIINTYGKDAVVWRFDPIIVSNITDTIESFTQIANNLTDLVDTVAISFMELHKKTVRGMVRWQKACKGSWRDPSLNEKRGIALKLYEIAKERNINLTICAQPDIITIQEKAICIDPQRLRKRGATLLSYKPCGNRPDCQCAPCRDIGEYDTCPSGCVYCYARSTNKTVETYTQIHDPSHISLNQKFSLRKIHEKNLFDEF